MKPLTTPRLRLEPLEPRHAAHLFNGLRDVRLYEFISDEPPASVSALKDRYQILLRGGSPDGSERWLNWAILCLERNQYIGFVQATLFPDGKATVAYLIFVDNWRQGFAREAVTALLVHLRDDWQVSEVRASVDTRHGRSIRLLESLGFERIAVHRNADRIKGSLADEAEYLRLFE